MFKTQIYGISCIFYEYRAEFCLIQYDRANNLLTRPSKLLNKPDKLLTKSLILSHLTKNIYIYS